MIELLYYCDSAGRSPFEKWFDGLDAQAFAKVTMALTRLSAGHTGNIKSVGGGLMEYKIDFGPGYRVYFGRDGDKLVILLCGGTKKRQQQDIETARECWQDYKQRRRAK